MPRYVEVQHQQWIAAPPATVRAQFADLDHHIHANVHPKLHFEVLERQASSARYVQEVRLLGIRQRDVFERQIEADGSMTDRSVQGFNEGGSLQFRFLPEMQSGRAGTLVDIVIRLPLPPVIGGLLRPLLAAQIRKELTAAALEDRDDIEQRGYPRAQSPARMNLRSSANAASGSSRQAP